MPLEQEDLKQISDLLKEQLAEFRVEFLKTEVAPMVSGATKRALTEAPQITSQQFEEQLAKLAESIQANQVDSAKLVQDAVSAVLQQLADMPDEEQPRKTGQDQSAFDPEAFRTQLQQEFMAEFEKTKLKPLTQKLSTYEDQLKAERDAREAAEKRNTINTRNQKYIDALIKSGQVDAGAAEMALDTAIKRGYLKPSEDESDFVVERQDKYGIETSLVSAIDHLTELVESKPEFQYFRPARAGTGFNSQPGINRTTPPGQPDLKVLTSTDPDAISGEFLLEAFRDGKGADVLKDLSAIERAG
jgi:hypothetical protein